MSGKAASTAVTPLSGWLPTLSAGLEAHHATRRPLEGDLTSALESESTPTLVQRFALSAIPPNPPTGPTNGPPAAVQRTTAGDEEDGVVQRACAACQDEEPEVQRQSKDDDEEAEGAVQSKCDACEQEEAATQRSVLSSGTSTRKLWVGSPGDTYERQADTVASAVMDGWEPYSGSAAGEASQFESPAAGSGSPAAVQRDETPDASTDDEEHDPELDDEVECQASSDGPPRDMGELSTRLASRRGRGAALPAPTLSFMSDRFESDFSSVRIHDDGEAAQLTDTMRARAFTAGRDVYFAPEQYRPGTPGGDRLLAHELTHVVQQSGGSTGTGGMVQRSACERRDSIYEESKPYTRDIPDLTGTLAHREIERKLEAANPNLITEAAIPGATRETVAYNALGFADLYKAEGNKVSKVRGICNQPKGGDQDDEARVPALRATFGAGAKSPLNPALRTHSAGSITYSPKRTATGGITGTFPSTFSVADLKPLSESRLGSGLIQIDNYMKGFPEFSKDVTAEVQPGLGTVSSGSALEDLTIPAPLDYVGLHRAKGFGRENRKSKSEASEAVFSPNGGVRLYIVQGGEGLKGLYVYFFVGTNIKHPVEKKFYKEQNKKLKPLIKGLKQGNPSVNPTLGTKLREGEQRPALPAISPLRTTGRSATAQTKRNRTPSTKRKQEQDAWFRTYDAWRKPLKGALKTKPQKNLKKKVEQDRTLKSRLKVSLPSEESAFTTTEQLEDFKQVRFWASGFGRLFARIRFALGTTFDKLAEKFETLRTKFKGIKKSAGGLGKLGGGFGFVAKFGRLVVKALGKGVAAFLDASFNIFAECANSLISAVTNRLTDGASEEVKEQICALETAYETLKTGFEAKISEFDQLETLVKAWQEISYWTGIASALKGAIQLAVQAAACVSPPALGCLWGLVAQVGIEVALDLIADTKWFQEKVIQHPKIQEIVDQYAGETYRQWMWNLITGAKLDTLLGEGAGGDALKACKPGSFDANKAMAEGTLGDAGFKRQRSRWERDNRTQLESEIAAAISGTGGETLTGREAQELITAIKESGLSPAELKKKVEALKAGGADGESGETPPKIDAHALLHSLGGTAVAPGEGTASSPVERRGLDDLVKIAASAWLDENHHELWLSPGWYPKARNAKPGKEPMAVYLLRMCNDQEIYAGFVNIRIEEREGLDYVRYVKVGQLINQHGTFLESGMKSLFPGPGMWLSEIDPKKNKLKRKNMMVCVYVQGSPRPQKGQ